MRLTSYGVRSECITATGFPLPPELVTSASSDLTRRLRRLRGEDAEAPLLTFAVGGAGAQAARARQLLRELAGPLRSGELRLALVAGLKSGLAARFRRWAKVAVEPYGEAVEVLHASTFEALYRSFNSLLSRTDVLWTKPSELSFYAALGVPLILDDPVGDHERANARLVLDAQAAVLRPPREAVAHAISDGLSRGAFARAAENGFRRLPRNGTERIAETVFNHC
jgi:UDP-N-acetylglucosamine:LPS N-acetylglucosamine transferase